MNKTININLGGYFFHIDETAYNKLKRYLDAIGKSLSDDPQGKNEIISDIEMRISELLSEKITDARQVVNEQDINDIIKIMGEPEAYAESEEGYKESKNYYSSNYSSTKKLFRDGDDKFLGGVASGLGHYANVDVVWVRIAFILLSIFGGFGIPAYIILWIVVPEAKSTAEKLQMEGEAVNIDNIEKKIREEFKHVTSKIKDGAEGLGEKISNADYKKYGKKAKSGFQEFLDTLGTIIVGFFKVIGKFAGFILMMVSAIVLVSFVIAIFSIGSLEIIGFEFADDLSPFFMGSTVPYWLISICALVLAGVPFIILFVLGVRILFNNVKQFSKATSLSLLGIWIIALLIVIFSAIEVSVGNAYYGQKSETKDLAITANDTLQIKLLKNEELYYDSYFGTKQNKRHVVWNNDKKIYSQYVKVDVRKSESDKAYAVIKKSSEGKTVSRANKNAESIQHNVEFVNNELLIDGYYISDLKSALKTEIVSVVVYVPEGVVVYFDETSEKYLNNVANTTNMYDNDMDGHYFLMSKEGLSCTDCTEQD